jgi:hypothetical protein
MEKAPYCITGPIPHFIRFDRADGGNMFLQNLLMSRKGYDLTAQEVFIKIQTAIETAAFPLQIQNAVWFCLRTIVPQYRIRLRSGGTRVTYYFEPSARK